MVDEVETMTVDVDDIETKDDETMYYKIEVWAIEYAQSIGINYALPMVSEPQIKMYGTADSLVINVNTKIVDMDTRHEFKPYVMLNINFVSVRIPWNMGRYFTHPVINAYDVEGRLISRKIVNMDDNRRLHDIAYLLYDSAPLSP